MIKTKHDGQYKQVGFIKVRQPDGTYKDVEKKYGRTTGGEYGLVFEKGFTREIEGASPLHLDGIGKPLKDYTIEGNTYQSDGVSPDTPQEVVGVGDRTGNLFYFPETKEDGSSVLIKRNEGESNFYITKNNDNNVKREVPINTVLKAGIYTLSVKGFLNNNDFIYFTNSDGSNVGYYTTLSSPKTFTLTEETAISNICCYTLSGSKYDNTEICVMLNEGSTPLPYEPYGYKVDVETRGKNLFDIEKWLTDNGATYTKNEGVYTFETKYTMFTTPLYFSDTDIPITISGIIRNISSTYARVTLVKADGIIAYENALTASTTVTKNITCAGLKFDWSTGGTVSFSNIMLNTGTTAEPYSPYTPPITTPIYLDSPLYKIGDYSDSRGMTEEVRVIKELVLTGKEDWKLQSINDYGIANFFMTVTPQFKTKSNAFCTHFIEQSSLIADTAFEGLLLAGSETLYLRTKQERASTATAFKSYLATQYTNGTPVKVYYVLSTPESKEVEPVEIPTLNGATVIDVDTEVKPSNVYIKYKSKT